MSQKKKSPPTIKFSHKYTKLLDCNGEPITQTKLIGIVYLPDIGKLHEEFIKYDTDDGLYKLPAEGKFMMLIFLKPKVKKSANLFTTLRSYDKTKYLYYRKLIGSIFNVEYI